VDISDIEDDSAHDAEEEEKVKIDENLDNVNWISGSPYYKHFMKLKSTVYDENGEYDRRMTLILTLRLRSTNFTKWPLVC
jgi:hypothetical protein